MDMEGLKLKMEEYMRDYSKMMSLLAGVSKFHFVAETFILANLKSL